MSRVAFPNPRSATDVSRVVPVLDIDRAAILLANTSGVCGFARIRKCSLFMNEFSRIPLMLICQAPDWCSSMTAINRRQKLEAMLAASPNDQMLRYMLAMEVDKESDHERSLELFRSLMNDAPPYVPAFLMAGQLLGRLERTNDARITYQTGIIEAQKQKNDHAAGEMTGFLQALD